MLYALKGSDPFDTKLSFPQQQVLIFSDNGTTNTSYKSARIDTN